MASVATISRPQEPDAVNDRRTIADDEAWAAVLRRDRALDGRFVTGVLTTGIYCRPSCAARHPKRENVDQAAAFEGRTPPIFEGRPLGLRGFGADGNIKNALLALPGEADAKIRALFEAPEIVSIHAHNATRGCFAARIERN